MRHTVSCVKTRLKRHGYLTLVSSTRLRKWPQNLLSMQLHETIAICIETGAKRKLKMYRHSDFRLYDHLVGSS